MNETLTSPEPAAELPVPSAPLLDCAIALLEIARCPNCDGGGAVQTGQRQLVTHDMALDAGCPEMEGSLYSDDEWSQCQWCAEKDVLIAKWKAQSNVKVTGAPPTDANKGDAE